MSAPVIANTTYLANIPSPSQGVWFLGPFPLRAYALCIIVGIIVAIIWSDRRWVARGGRKGTVTDIAVFAVPFGLVGGRLYHVATDWHKYFGPDRNPVDALKIWEGGLGIWGAVALGAVGAWIGCRYYKVPLPAFADAVAPGLILAQAIGRLGNWFNQELYGQETTLPWGLEIYQRINKDTGLADPINGVAMDPTPVAVVHPTFLYELLWNVLVALVLVWADRKFRLGHGRVFAAYVALYSFGRLWIEMLRTDEATLIAGIRINVFTSIILFLLGAAYLFWVRGEREDPAALRGKPLPGDDDTSTGDSGAETQVIGQVDDSDDTEQRDAGSGESSSEKASSASSGDQSTSGSAGSAADSETAAAQTETADSGAKDSETETAESGAKDSETDSAESGAKDSETDSAESSAADESKADSHSDRDSSKT